jgi:hypothetical protein
MPGWDRGRTPFARGALPSSVGACRTSPLNVKRILWRESSALFRFVWEGDAFSISGSVNR